MGVAQFWAKMQEKRVQIDPISNICILGALLLFGIEMFVFLPNVHDDEQIMELVLRSAVAFTFLVGGIAGMMFSGVHIPRPQTRGGDIDLNLTVTEWTMILFWMAIDLMVIVVISNITYKGSSLFAESFLEYPDSLFRWVVFSTAIGWTEEVFFRGYMLTAVSRWSGDVVAVITSTVAWAAFHGGVYGLMAQPLIIIGVTGLILSISMIGTGYRLSTTMLPHGLNNFIAIATQGAIVNRAILPLVMVMLR